MKTFSLFTFQLIPLAFFSLVAGFSHPFYVSVTEIAYNSPTQTLEIGIKIFADDWDACLQKSGQAKLHLNTEKESPLAQKTLEEYLRKHFSVSVNNTSTPWNWVGKEAENDAIWVYVEIPNQKSIHSLNIRNEILVACQETQSNLVHTDIYGKRKSLRFELGKTSEVLLFNPPATRHRRVRH